MREIKFRIIHKDKIVGYEHLTETGWKWNWIELNPDKGERWSNGVIEHSTPTAMIRNQFTGLKDKNGKDIYEGDFIQNVADNGKRLSKFEISWQQSCCGFVKEREDGHTFTLEISKYFEVIGNKFENPEPTNF